MSDGKKTSCAAVLAGLVALVLLVAFVVGLVMLGSRLGRLGWLLDAIIMGGIGGGFTLALVGGESYGLKMPGRAGGSARKFDPGLFGDVFVGLMAGFLGIGFGIWAKTFSGLFDVTHEPFAELAFTDFAIAYACGFLGLRLIKAVAARVLKTEELEQKLMKTEANEADVAYLKGAELLRDDQFEAARDLFLKSKTLEGEGSIRSLIGLGRAYRRLGTMGDAIAVLDEAVQKKDKDGNPHRIAVAYWNRACYRTLASSDVDKEIDAVLGDLEEAIKLQASFAHDLTTDKDLTKIQEAPKFKAFAEKFAGKKALP
jgi:hypothetical protein